MGFLVCKIKDLIQEKPIGRICSSLDRHWKCSWRWKDVHLSVQRSGDAQVQRAVIRWCTGAKGCIPWQEVLQVYYSWHKEPALYSCFNSGCHWLHFMLWSHGRRGSKQSFTFCASHGLQIPAKLYWHAPSFNYSHFSHSFPIATSPSEDVVIRTPLRVPAVKKPQVCTAAGW